MRELVFATNNYNKVEEIKAVIGNFFNVITLREAGIDIDIPEPYDTLEANARTKSQTIHQLTNKDCFSEDTGLETEALNGEPGVRSARYAGDNRSSSDNVQKLLQHLEGVANRKARFRTIISLIIDGEEYQFEGICSGTIITTPKGQGGFGYDSVFVPVGDTRTFAEMTIEEKNKFSHRKKATSQLITFLSQRGKK